MGTRRIQGPARHPFTNALYQSAVLRVRNMTAYASGSASYPGETVSITTDGSGQFDVTLGTPDTGTHAFEWKLPGCAAFTLNIGAGADTTLHALINAESAVVSPSALQTHADLIATADALGHIRVGTGLDIDPDTGVLSADGGGGAVDSVNGQTGVVVLGADDVGADASGTAAGLVASEATARSGADTTLQSNITNEASARAAADLLRLLIASDLSDLHSIPTARTNLGLGALAVLGTITASLISDASANGRSLIQAANYAAMRTLLSLVPGTDVQAYSAVLLALAGLTNAANKGIVFSGGGAAATFDLSAFALTFLDDANAAAVRTTLGLVIGTDVQAQSANLAALAGLTLAADKLAYATGAGALALTTLSSYIRTLLDDADAATALLTLGAQKAIPDGRWQASGGTVYECVPGATITVTGTTSIGANQINYLPIEAKTTITLDQILMEITSAAGAGNTIRLAIYNADSNNQPTSLVLDAGTIASDSTGIKAASINQQLTPGRYLLAFNSSASCTVRYYVGSQPSAPFSSAVVRGLFSVATAYGAFASTGVQWSAAGSGATGGIWYFVWVRVSTP